MENSKIKYRDDSSGREKFCYGHMGPHVPAGLASPLRGDPGVGYLPDASFDAQGERS